MIHDVLTFLRTWSPHIWLFGSVFGILMSGTLLHRVWEQRVMQKFLEGEQRETSRFWFRHGLWFFLLHSGYVFIGVTTIAKVNSDWTDLLTLFFLVTTPLVLVYRSYDCLRLDRRLRTGRTNGRDAH